MPSMNIGMQRRIGKLPKTGEYNSGTTNGYFGYGHRGFSGKRPTTRYEGFFGIGSGWYGNDSMAQSDMPVNGFYGATDEDDGQLDAYLNGHYLAGGDKDMSSSDDVTGMMDNKIQVSEGFVLSQQAIMLAAGAGLLYLLSRN